MTTYLSPPWPPSNPHRFGKFFSRLGWIGFFIQLLLLVVPIVLLFYVLLLSAPDSASRKGVDLGNYLSNGSLIIMVFTTFWFFRYTRIGRQIADPEMCPSQRSIVRTVWIGLWASILGIFFSILLMIGAVGRLLLVLMANPQTGLQIAPALGGDPRMSLSAIDAVSLTALLVTLAAELIIAVFSLWLLFRLTRPSTAQAEPSDDAEVETAPL